MIQSMTAFARESAPLNEGVLTVELRTVNHRYLDCTFKLPDALRVMEPRLRDEAGKALARGKLECLVRLQAHQGNTATYRIDDQRLTDLLQAVDALQKQLREPAPVNALQILQFPGVYAQAEETNEALQQAASTLFSEALKNLQDTREREGQKLAGLVLDRLSQVELEVEATRKVLPELREQQKKRLLTRIEDLGVDADPVRIEQELVFLAQRADVDEELDRLDAHISEVRRALQKGGPCGRRLDFLMQELNREANTLSSKSQSSETTQNAVELKVLIEQMREQIQNIE